MHTGEIFALFNFASCYKGGKDKCICWDKGNLNYIQESRWEVKAIVKPALNH